jgi:hypothetical protein
VIPVVPWLAESAVSAEIDLCKIGRFGCGKPFAGFRERRGAIGLPVDVVKRTEGCYSAILSQSFEKNEITRIERIQERREATLQMVAKRSLSDRGRA